MAFASAASKLSARLQENLSEAARDFGLNHGFSDFAAVTTGGSTSITGSSGGRHLESNSALSSDEGTRETHRLLESSRDRDKEEGVRRVLALQLKNRPVAHYFASITACLSSHNISLRELVAVYILNQASKDPDMALMSVNMFQKDLNDASPAVRALAIRVLAGMNLEAIASLVITSLRRASRDLNWHVRRTVAHALPKLYQQDPAHLESVIPILQGLLADRSPLVVGSAVAVFEEVCPDHIELLHAHYRHICASLVDSDEWGQLAIIRTMARYARLNFLKPTTSDDIDQDLQRFLSAAEKSLQSSNPAVSMAAVRVVLGLAPSSSSIKAVFPLLRLLHASEEIQQLALYDVAVLAQSKPRLFHKHVLDFYVKTTDAPAVKRLKLVVLTHLVNADNVQQLLKELQLYALDVDLSFASDSIKAIGSCAQRQSQVTGECLGVLLQFLTSPNESIASQAIVVLKVLLSQLDSQTTRFKTISTLVQYLHASRLKDAQARASVYWLVGQFAEEGPLETFGPDALRYGAKTFATETRQAKIEICNLASKLLVLSHQIATDATKHVQRPLALLFEYTVSLALYDLDYTVRDRARFLRGLITGVGLLQDATRMDAQSFASGEDIAAQAPKIFNVEQVKVLLFEASENQSQALQEDLDESQFGSLALITGQPIFRPATLPPWTTKASDPALRVPEKPSNGIGSASPHQSLSNASLSSSTMPGFGSDSLRRGGMGAGAASTVLTPTVGGSTSGASRASERKDLNRFLAESSEEEDSSSGSESSEAEDAVSDSESSTDSSDDSGTP